MVKLEKMYLKGFFSNCINLKILQFVFDTGNSLDEFTLKEGVLSSEGKLEKISINGELKKIWESHQEEKNETLIFEIPSFFLNQEDNTYFTVYSEIEKLKEIYKNDFFNMKETKHIKIDVKSIYIFVQGAFYYFENNKN